MTSICTAKMATKNSIQVAIKLRPLHSKEKEGRCWKVVDNTIQLKDGSSDPYIFDHIFDEEVCNQIIFDKMAKNIVHSAIHGFNGTIFAYGQTSSGKTYTMMGDEHNPGVMVLAANEIFNEIERTTDRQFLMRVGYIEIYNENIYDLLNKKNSDLKIHESTAGIINVSNCEEQNIRCKEDLLQYLCLGNKERTVGETNMNERSSRSHAIFRIIIESQKMNIAERSKDDAITMSVLNLVDLAGSERADQSGARGTRLKEGGHINKSLMFLSNVIKQLSENEKEQFVSYRDSKLTRILQASLGGNALTSIICTIKPTAVEETKSTLSFAMRAKTVKNKPHVNEIISDATMMKRLERKIKDLETNLANERSKNQSQIKVGQLEQRIKNEVLKIISFNSLQNIRTQKEKRRRTWCPETSSKSAEELEHQSQQKHLVAPTLLGPPIPSRLKCFTPQITIRATANDMAPPPFFHQPKQISPQIVEMPNEEEEEEHFVSSELCKFQWTSPVRDRIDFRTPDKLNKLSITPHVAGNVHHSLETIKHDFLELQEFTNLENKIHVDHDAYGALKKKLDTLTQRNVILENERIEYINTKIELDSTKGCLKSCEKRCDDLQIAISKLTMSKQNATSKNLQYEQELAALKTSIEKLEVENREAVSLDFEFQRHKNKTKLREKELIEAMSEKDKKIEQLEKSLSSITQKKLQISKEDLMELSRGGMGESLIPTEDGSICVKCEDLQRLLDDNRKVQLDFEKLTLAHEELQLTYKHATEDAVALTKFNEKQDTTTTNLHLKITALNEQLASTREENKRVKLDYEKLMLKHEEVQKSYKQSTEDAVAIQATLSEFKEKHDTTALTITNLDLEITALNEQLASTREENKRVKLDYEKLMLKHEEVQKSYKQSTEDAVAIEATFSEFKEKHDTTALTITNLDLEIAALNEQLASTREEKKKVQLDHEKLMLKHEEVQKSYKQATEDAVAIQATLSEFKEKHDTTALTITNLDLEITALNEQLASTREEKKKVQLDHEKLMLKHEEVQKSYKQATEDAVAAQAALAVFKEKYDITAQTITNLSLKITALDEQLASTREENKKVQLDYEKLMLSYEEVKTSYKQATEEVYALQAGLVEKHSVDEVTITNMHQGIVALNEKLETINSEDKNVQVCFEKPNDENKKLQLDSTQAMEKIRPTKITPNQDTDDTNTKFRLAMAALNKVLKIIQQKYTLAKCEFEAKCKDCELKKNISIEQIGKTQEKHDILQSIWHNQQQSITEIEAENKNLQRKYQNLQTDYDKLEQTTAQSLKDCVDLQRVNEALQVEINELKTCVEEAQKKLQDIGAKSDVQQQNTQLLGQLAEQQRQFADLQQEYDDLSNQLMDSVQEEENLRSNCKELETKLNALMEKNEISTSVDELQVDTERNKLESDISCLKSQLGVWLTNNESRSNKSISFDSISSRKKSFTDHESMRSSGVCIDEENGFGSTVAVNADLLSQFMQLIEAVHEIELEYVAGKCRIFTSDLRQSADQPAHKLLLRNMQEIAAVSSDQQGDLNSNEKVYMQGTLKHPAFHIVELQPGKVFNDVKRNTLVHNEAFVELIEHNEQLKRQIQHLSNNNECLRAENNSLLEANQRNISEMREEIEKLSTELFEKSLVIENCACENYQTQIESLKKECLEVTIICEEMQEKITKERPDKNSKDANDTLCDDENIEQKNYDEAHKAVVAELKVEMELQVDHFKTQCKEYEKRYDAAEATINAMQEEHQQNLSEAQSACEDAKAQLAIEERKFKDECNRLQLELYEKLELNETDFRDTLRKSNREWELSKDRYEETIKVMRQQLKSQDAKCDNCDKLQTKITELELQSSKSEEGGILQKEKLNDILQKLEELKKYNEKLVSERDLLEQERDDILLSNLKHDQNQQSTQELFAELKEIQLKFSDAKKQLVNLGDINDKLQNEKDKIKNELAKKESEQKSLQDELFKRQELEPKFFDVKTKLKDLEEINRQLQIESDILKQKRVKNNKALEEVRATLEKAELNLKELKAANEKLSKETDVLQKERVELLRSMQDQNTLQAKLLKLEEVTKLLEIEKSEMKTHFAFKNKELQEKLQKEFATVVTISGQMRELEKSLKEIQPKYENALQELKQEKENLSVALKQQSCEKTAFVEREATLYLKIKALTKLNETNLSAATALEQLKSEHEQLQKLLGASNVENDKLLRQIQTLVDAQQNAKQEDTLLQTEVQKLQKQYVAFEEERKTLLLELQRLQTQLTDDHSTLQKQRKEYESSVAELELKVETLQQSNVRLQEINSSLDQQLRTATRQVAECHTLRQELERLTTQRDDLQSRLKQSVAKADQCRQDLEEHLTNQSGLLDRHTKERNNLHTLLTTSKDEKHKLEKTVSCLLLEKNALEEKLHLTQEITKKLNTELSLVKLESSGNSSVDLNILGSPRSRMSLDRFEIQQLKSINVLADDKISPMQQKVTEERKSRRQGTHDERRSQSFWGMTRDVASMTDPTDKSCNCVEMDGKLKELERELFIRESQVTALTFELKNHPLKAQNAKILKRLEEREEQYRIENKKYQHIIAEQKIRLDDLAKLKKQLNAPPKIVANVEVQTHCDSDEELQTLQVKYKDLKNICRNRGQVIKDLEAELAKENLGDGNQPMTSLELGRQKVLRNECEKYKKELAVISNKYEQAKRILAGRLEENIKLRAQVDAFEKNAA